MPDPDPAKVGSIYNFAGKERVSEPGAAVGRAYREKPWLTGAPLGTAPMP